MLQVEPELRIKNLLVNEWDASATTEDFNTSHISTGWFSENREHPQITVTHVGDAMDGNTGYTAISPDGPSAWVRGRAQVDVWVPNIDSWSSPGAAKDHRWQLFQEVKRIIHANATGVTDSQNRQQLAGLGTISSRRLVDSDANPIVFRASADVRYSYHQRPPESA